MMVLLNQYFELAAYYDHYNIIVDHKESNRYYFMFSKKTRLMQKVRSIGNMYTVVIQV